MEIECGKAQYVENLHRICGYRNRRNTDTVAVQSTETGKRKINNKRTKWTRQIHKVQLWG